MKRISIIFALLYCVHTKSAGKEISALFKKKKQLTFAYYREKNEADIYEAQTAPLITNPSTDDYNRNHMLLTLKEKKEQMLRLLKKIEKKHTALNQASKNNKYANMVTGRLHRDKENFLDKEFKETEDAIAKINDDIQK